MPKNLPKFDFESPMIMRTRAKLVNFSFIVDAYISILILPGLGHTWQNTTEFW